MQELQGEDQNCIFLNVLHKQQIPFVLERVVFITYKICSINGSNWRSKMFLNPLLIKKLVVY